VVTAAIPAVMATHLANMAGFMCAASVFGEDALDIPDGKINLAPKVQIPDFLPKRLIVGPSMVLDAKVLEVIPVTEQRDGEVRMAR
jgi:hypothetical protein